MAGQVQIRILQKAQMSFFGHQAAAAVALKLRRFTVTLCVHRFCGKNVVNLFYKNMLTDSENRCVLPLVRNAG